MDVLGSVFRHGEDSSLLLCSKTDARGIFPRLLASQSGAQLATSGINFSPSRLTWRATSNSDWAFWQLRGTGKRFDDSHLPLQTSSNEKATHCLRVNS